MRLIDADKVYEERFTRSKIEEGVVVHVNIIEANKVKNAPTVDAIPIDWIIKWANKNCMYCCDYDYPTERTDGWFDINDMVKEWKKKNEEMV